MIGAAGVAQQQPQQLSSEAEAAAAQLLLGVVAAIEESVSFPDAVNAWYREGGPGGPAGGSAKKATSPGNTAQPWTAASVAATSEGTLAPGQGEIRRAGMREVGSFLWALNRAEGGLGAPEAKDTAALLSAAAVAASETPPSPFGNIERHAKVLNLQQAARLAAHNIRRPGGFADKLALYCEAAIRAANDCLLQPGGLLRTSTACPSDTGKGTQPRSFGALAAAAASGVNAVAASGEALGGDYRPQTVLASLRKYCVNIPTICKSPMSLRRQERPPMSWVSTAGVSLGLLLNFFSSCRTEARFHILWVTSVARQCSPHVSLMTTESLCCYCCCWCCLVQGVCWLQTASVLRIPCAACAVFFCRSGIMHAPLLAAECGLLQLFHLLRPLAATARTGLAESEVLDSEKGDLDHFDDSLRSAAGACDPSTLHSPTAVQQLADPTNSSCGSSMLRLLQGAGAFLFAVAAALLRHAQSISALPSDSPRTAAQLQLLLLASSDFATLLHAHCSFTAAGAAATQEKAQGAGNFPKISVVTASAEFRCVLQELLSIFSSLVVRHAPQIRESLALLAAAAEALSLCGRYVPLPSGSKKALEAFASAAIAALRQPTPYQAGQRGAPGTPSSQVQRGGGAEELRRLATALEALKFVQLK